MGFERKAQGAVVVHHMLGERHDGKRDVRLGAGLARRGVIEQGQRQLLRQAAHLPQRLAAIVTERAEGISRGKALERGAADAAPPPQIADVSEEICDSEREGTCGERWSKEMREEFRWNAVADRDDGLHVVLAQAINLPHAETQREIHPAKQAPACSPTGCD